MIQRDPFRRRRAALVAAAAWCLASPAALAQFGPPPTPAELAAAAQNRTVVSGESWIVDKTTELRRLKVEAGASIAAAPGRSLTMTVDGVQTTLQPGSYRGQIVLTVSEQRTLKFSPFLTHQFRQALLLDARGVVASQSVTAAAGPFQLKDGVLSGALMRSNGANFNGLLVTGGRYTVKDLVLDFDGDGGNDFAGHGAGVMSDGKDTRLVLDGARIHTRGVVRTAVVGHNGSHLIVKNSEIMARAGKLAADYISNVTPGEMKDAPWMLGISGNNRATNVLGDDTVVTYIGSRIAAESWGVLSVDNSRRIKLTAINSQVEVTGGSGYGTYAIGDSTNAFYGSTILAPSMGAIVTGGRAIFAASSADNLQRLDRELKLELGAAGIAALKPAQTRVVSPRNGVMLWGEGGEVQVRDGTVFDTGEAVFLNKGATAKISVDGSGGAQLKARNGVLLQQMDNDDPGPQMTDGLLANTGIWRDPTTPAKPVPGHDLASEHDTDSTLSLAKIRLQGDVFNAMRELQVRPPFDPDKPGMAPPRIAGANLIVSLVDAELKGAVTAATARHLKNPIGAADYESLGRVTNTPSPAINNGVIVKLERSRWTVTGPSHLTRLNIGPGSTVSGADGATLRLTVDGVAKALRPGDYRGQILLQPVQ